MVAHKFHKFKLLLDENFPIRTYLPKLNSRYDLKHIAEDLNKSGISDTAVYEIAITQQRILVTFNYKDFRDMVETSIHSGLIGISPNLSFDQIDKKLTALLSKAGKKELLGKFTFISGESE